MVGQGSGTEFGKSVELAKAAQETLPSHLKDEIQSIITLELVPLCKQGRN